MAKRQIEDHPAPLAQEIFSSVIPSPTTKENIAQQDQMIYPNGGNILYPPRKLPIFGKLTPEESSLVDSFLRLEKAYRKSEWAKLGGSKITLPSLASTIPDGDTKDRNIQIPDNISPAHAMKLGMCMTESSCVQSDPLTTHNTEEYLTRALLRDSIIMLGRIHKPKQHRKIHVQSPDSAAMSVLQRVSLKDTHADAHVQAKQLETTLSPCQSDLEALHSSDNDSDSLMGEDDGDMNYEDYF